MLFTKAVSGLAILAGLVAAHPGHDASKEAAERRAYLQNAKRTSLAHCADKLRARGTESRNIVRRKAVVEKARQKRGLTKRDFSDVLGTDHNKTTLGYTPNTDAATLFAGYNSCLLTPEVTQGPYYVAGEYVRENVVEDQPGLPLLLEYQVVDVATCEPVPEVYVEIWHCNATGVYGGVVASGNGDSSDASNLDNTFLRGIQPTDAEGVAQFESVFPGHYTGRATHIHIMVHTNATLQANQTLGLDNYASHVGQAFFDQALITAVEKLEPYASNQQPLTTNEEDSIMAEESATDGVDPVMEYTLLGDNLSDGLFAWIAFGIDTTRSEAISPAVYLEEGGGRANPDAGGPGGPGGSFPTGSFPTGGFPVPTGNVGRGIGRRARH
ncbi:Intradiol ring-cleavage dioxygenase-like protein [Thermothelomyces thermophilus ATCC 42464]|uniref:Intradiol ring-cleavage dioxygenase-like protein n=1 Tax=Thermothelomyces thermophilus (strain ATCC 42464 / BCRC 31852 / DSM 1799) TaxID=573729 RepID=G2QKY8_THET4|nr:Intradiol ring-cleavage dioxygenase-like protein [Thermothelomyces thermophilus ATCC 42464]AEO60620.1 Intradiol ring-cleavage dioxygenase-like protein [Thermothelomyces thermophilus ATCC 42464]